MRDQASSRARPALAALALAVAASPAIAQPAITAFTIDGGGGVASGGVFRLTGTIGQPDAAQRQSAGATTLTGGFVNSGQCPPDYNGVNGLNVQDIFDFLNGWFAGDPRADFNGLNGLTVQDIFDFLNAWFAGC